jgi:hypothetical protein
MQPQSQSEPLDKETTLRVEALRAASLTEYDPMKSPGDEQMMEFAEKYLRWLQTGER